ncbi:MAG TPA: long-chain fatty acid--CoA ligase [Burkholderiaceae bacterium]|nr:long-chain fatty acid--CoA ligase [Burkholderiaceae bacterium]
MAAHPWISSYPLGVHWDAPLPVMPVQQLLDDAVARWGDQPALDSMGRRISYREFGALTAAAARGLQRLGVGPGVHVGLYLPNTPHYPIALFAVLKAGGTVVNYSPLDAERVLAHKIADSETDFLITLDSAALYPNMARIAPGSRLKKLIVGGTAQFAAQSDAARAQLERSGQLSKIPADELHVPFAALLDNDGAYTRHPLGDLRDAIAVLQYTGGTTGLAKGAMLTHANLTSACAQYFETTRGDPPLVTEGDERVLVVLPLFHVYSLTVNLLLGVRLGATHVLHSRFDLDALMHDLEAKRITIFAAVPTMYTAIINHPKAAQLDLRSLKYCASGGAPLPAEVAQRFLDLTGCPIVEGWGMTETSPIGTFTPARGLRRAGSCGLPAPGVRIALRSLDDPAADVPRGERGELCIAGPNVMKGYWKNPDATRASTTPDGYFRSGDVATMDDDGFVFIVDRAKDMLLCGGFNVYPRVLEEAIYEHPAVAEVAVIGIHDEYRGQSPKAFVTLKAGAAPFTLDELRTFLGGRLGKHEMVQALEIRAELPKTAVGKLSKKELIDEEERKRAQHAA